ncbi:anthrone oxygenase family protein [Streptomyces sp. IBSNAI002]|uniref:anthrone oxygenase family protein n=1 Tax=Streptomyces sp. IBSNAI002 TaxID=3457500 RepID=UPI003FD5B1BD
MSLRRTGVLVAATLTSGLTAGLFASVSYAVMPALARSDDRTFVEFMQNINEVILNPVFMPVFLGGLACAVAAAVTHRRTADKALRAWILVGAAGYLAMFAVTAGVHVPLNYELAAAGDPGRIQDLAALRDAVEDKWVAWNTVRALANVVSFAGFSWALVLLGRSEDRSGAPGLRERVTAS